MKRSRTDADRTRQREIVQAWRAAEKNREADTIQWLLEHRAPRVFCDAHHVAEIFRQASGLPAQGKGGFIRPQ